MVSGTWRSFCLICVWTEVDLQVARRRYGLGFAIVGCRIRGSFGPATFLPDWLWDAFAARLAAARAD